MYLGIDLGTSSMKFLVCDNEYNIVYSKSFEYLVNYTNNGWADQNPKDWVDALKKGFKDLKEIGYLDKIKSLGISGQMHGLVVLDENKKSIYPVILWNDQRTYKQNEYLNNNYIKQLLENTANMSFTGFTASKILWLKENEKEVFSRVRYIMLPKDYLNYILTDTLASDVSDNSGTLFFDVKNRKWSKNILKILGIEENMLSKSYESYEIISEDLSESIKKEFNIKQKITVVAGASDNAAGAVGAGVINQDTILISLGTSGVVYMPSKEFLLPKKPFMHTFCDALSNYHYMGVILSASSCLKWWVENITKIGFKETLKDVNNVSNDNIYFLPYLNGERTPHSDPNARGCFIGINPNTNRNDMTRSILEGISFALYDAYNLRVEKTAKKIRVIGGGSKSDEMINIISSLFNLPVEILEIEEGPSYGALILSIIGHKNIKDREEFVTKLVKVKKIINPDNIKHKRYIEKYEKFRLMYNNLKPVFENLN